MRTLIVTLLGLCGLSLSAGAVGFPKPAEAGFHHCALIYERATRGPEDLAHYVARPGASRDGWLFDAFLFLIQRTGRDIRAENGETQKEDWLFHLDQWFAPGRDLAALDAALESAAKRLGPPPARRQVMLSIPYPHPSVTDFGDVNGDGVSESLATLAGKKAVLAWYIAEAEKRFRAAGYRHLDLWGFYWMNESISLGDEPGVRAASELIHARGKRLLWIPYYRSTGWDRWREAGIDVAILQPNYAFTTPRHGGVSARNRLAVTADLAREHGMGVEIEANNIVSDPHDRRVFLHYLADGATLGYQRAASAWYLGTDTLERIAASPQPDLKRLYDTLADYVRGKATPDPDVALEWAWSREGSAPVATARIPDGVPIATVEITLKEPDAAWRGSVRAEVRQAGSETWKPGGWAVRATGDASSGPWQVVRVPVEEKAREIRVTFRPDEGSPPLRVTRMTVDPHLPARSSHMASGASYRFTPDVPGTYPDSGTLLTDGRIAEGFVSGGTVGWQGASVVSVMFDLGRVMPVERVEAHMQGGGAAAVNWPSQVLGLLASDAPPRSGFSGLRAPPQGLTVLRAGAVAVDRRRNANDTDGHIVLTPESPTPARYVSLMLEPNGWLMLSEVRILSGGRNVAPDATYTLRPLPSGSAYADDGARLTDGIVAQGLERGAVTGWEDDAPREIVVDLGASRAIHRVTVWSLRGGKYGIYGPKSIEADVSADGAAWTRLGRATGPSGPEDGSSIGPAAYAVDAPADTAARYVRIRAIRLQAWAMLSEIEVR